MRLVHDEHKISPLSPLSPLSADRPYTLRAVKESSAQKRRQSAHFSGWPHTPPSKVSPMRVIKNLGLVLAGFLSIPAVVLAQGSGTMPTHAHAATPDSTAVRGLLTGLLGSRGPSGSAVVSGKILQLEWTGDQPGNTRPWSLRRGSCTRDAGAFGAAASFAPLTVDAGGNARASIALDAALPTGSAYYVAVHAFPAGAEGAVLACGSLSNGVKVAGSAGAIDHSAMDHSTMDHSSTKMGPPKSVAESEKEGMPEMDMSVAPRDSISSRLMAIHLRMMADPVIRERVLTDPVLQRMIGDIQADSAKLSMTGTTVAPKSPTAKSTAKKAAASKPAAKPVPRPAAPAMPGMDHGKMPGMKKPPA